MRYKKNSEFGTKKTHKAYNMPQKTKYFSVVRTSQKQFSDEPCPVPAHSKPKILPVFSLLPPLPAQHKAPSRHLPTGTMLPSSPAAKVKLKRKFSLARWLHPESSQLGGSDRSPLKSLSSRTAWNTEYLKNNGIIYIKSIFSLIPCLNPSVTFCRI